MSFSYSGDPSSSALDEVRFLTGDTDRDNFFVHDEEITWALTIHPKIEGKANYIAAAVVAETTATKMASSMTKSVEGVSIQYGERYQHFVDTAERLRELSQDHRVSTFYGGPVLLGGGEKYLGPDDSPETYANDDVEAL